MKTKKGNKKSYTETCKTIQITNHLQETGKLPGEQLRPIAKRVICRRGSDGNYLIPAAERVCRGESSESSLTRIAQRVNKEDSAGESLIRIAERVRKTPDTAEQSSAALVPVHPEIADSRPEDVPIGIVDERIPVPAAPENAVPMPIILINQAWTFGKEQEKKFDEKPISHELESMNGNEDAPAYEFIESMKTGLAIRMEKGNIIHLCNVIVEIISRKKHIKKDGMEYFSSGFEQKTTFSPMIFLFLQTGCSQHGNILKEIH